MRGRVAPYIVTEIAASDWQKLNSEQREKKPCSYLGHLSSCTRLGIGAADLPRLTLKQKHVNILQPGSAARALPLRYMNNRNLPPLA